MADSVDHGSQVMNLNEGSPPQEHLDVAMQGMPGQPFGFNNVPQSHLPNPHVQFDRNNAINAYKQVQNIGPLGFNGSNVNFHHDMSIQRSKSDGYGSEDDDYGQSPAKRKLDDVMQRQQHSNREKKRRNEMNEAIETIKLLLPQSDKNRFRVTKVSVLNEAIEYIQRIKELCMILAKDKRELHDDNNRLYQQLASLGKDVGEPRRWDDRNLMETLQSSVNLPNSQNSLREAPFSPNGRLDYQNDFSHLTQQGPGFPFGIGGPIGHPGMPPHLGGPFHPGMPMMGPIRMPGPRGGPMPPHMSGMDFNPMAYPFFPGRMEHNPNFQDFRQFPQEGQEQLNQEQLQQEHPDQDQHAQDQQEHVQDQQEHVQDQQAHDQQIQDSVSNVNNSSDNHDSHAPQSETDLPQESSAIQNFS